MDPTHLPPSAPKTLSPAPTRCYADRKAGWHRQVVTAAVAQRSSLERPTPGPVGPEASPEWALPLPDGILAIVAAGAAEDCSRKFPFEPINPLTSAGEILNTLRGVPAGTSLSRNHRNLIVIQGQQFLERVPQVARTRQACWACVHNDALALEFVPLKFLDEAICLAAVRQKGFALKFVPEHLRTEAVCRAAVQNYGWALKDVPSSLKEKSVCDTAVANHGAALEHVPVHLRDAAICERAVRECGSALEHVPLPLRSRALCLTAVTRYGLALQDVPLFLRDAALCRTALQQNGWAFQHLPPRLRENRDLWIAAVQQNWKLLEYAPATMAGYRDVCEAAIRTDGMAWFRASIAIQQDPALTALAKQTMFDAPGDQGPSKALDC